MVDQNCAYCVEGDLVAKFGIKICELETSKVYLFKEQSHPGRCIVAHKKHVGDMNELTAEERAAYFEDVARVARAIMAAFHPDKVNYGAYGDTGHHLHFHLCPKYKDEFEWGGVFLMNPDKKYLTDAEYAEMIEKIKAKISFQEEIIDKNRRLKTGAYEDFKSDFISREEYKAFTAQFDQQIKEASDTIMRLTSERNSVMGGLAEQQSWLEQFRKYANIKELTRSTVVNLIDYIHIRENKDIDVGLMHCDRFASIVEFLRERQEKEDANKVIRFERKVV